MIRRPVLLVLLVWLSVLPARAEVDSDERVLLFPTTASYDREIEAWRVPVHAWLYEPEENSLWRREALEDLADAMDLPPGERGSRRFHRRARMFLVDNERGESLVVHLAGRTWRLSETGANGHAETEVELSNERVIQAVGVNLLMLEAGDRAAVAGSWRGWSGVRGGELPGPATRSGGDLRHR